MDSELNQDTSSMLDIPVDWFPAGDYGYKIQKQIASGANAKVFKAASAPSGSGAVAVKVINLKEAKVDSDTVHREMRRKGFLFHSKLLKPFYTVAGHGEFIAIMPWMPGGSLQSILATLFQEGMPEELVATVLKDILIALEFLHGIGYVHKDIKAGNILIDSSNGVVKLADFCCSSSIYECSSVSDLLNSGDASSLTIIDVSGNPYWISPEVIKSPAEYTNKADIWSFGIVAMELVYGRCPVSEIPQSNSLKMKILKRFQFCDRYKKVPADPQKSKRLSKDFKEMVGLCLDEDPSKRPSAEELLLHPFFKKSLGADFLIKFLRHLPKAKAMLVDEAKIQRSLSLPADENEDERRLSAWKYNEEIFKLEPIYVPPEKVLSQGIEGEIVIPEKGEEDAKPKGSMAGVDFNAKFMTQRSTMMQAKCHEQKLLVQQLVELIRHYESMEEQAREKIMTLILEQDEERMKRFELELELECIRQWKSSDGF